MVKHKSIKIVQNNSEHFLEVHKKLLYLYAKKETII